MGRPAKPYQRADGLWCTKIQGRKIYAPTEAEIWRKLRQARGERGSIQDAQPLSIAGLTEAWLTLHPHETAVGRANALVSWAGTAALADVDGPFLQRYLAYLNERGNKAHTIVGYMTTARAIVRLAVREGWVEREPDWPRLPKRPRTPRPMTDSEVSAIEAAFLRSSRRRHYWRIFRFMLLTGARGGEACRLRWEWLHDVGFQIPAALHKTGKSSGHDRVILLSPEAREWLGSARSSGYVFTKLDGRPYVSRLMTEVFHRASVAALGYSRGMHQLRHTFADRARHTLAPDELMVAMGHADIAMTLRYYSRARSSVVDALRGLRIGPPAAVE